MNPAAWFHRNRRRNDFQELMFSWKELCPYNAAHILKVSGAADLTRWEEAFHRTLKEIEPEVEPLRVETSRSTLDDTVAHELNRPFGEEEPPLRVVIVQPEPDSHFLIAVYDHWFADSPSIRLLVQRAFHAYRADPTALPPIRISDAPGASGAPVLANLRALANALRTFRLHRRAYCINLEEPLDFQTGFLYRHFAAGVIHDIRAMARQCNAKVNDVFVAAAAQVLGEYTAQKRANARRGPFQIRCDRVGIASAVDLREPAAEAAEFGCAVGYYTVVLESPERIVLADLIRTVAKESAAKKTKIKAGGFSRGLKYAQLFWKFFRSPDMRAYLFFKGLPLLAAVSNANLSGSWIEDSATLSEGPRLLDYLRVSPVGPILPLIFTLTTIGDRLSLCVTFRTTAFPIHVAQQLTDALMAKLRRFTE